MAHKQLVGLVQVLINIVISSSMPIYLINIEDDDGLLS